MLLIPCFATVACAQGTPRLPTLFLVGDLSSATVQPAFDSATIHLQESSGAGQTTRSYLHSGAWDGLLAQVHPGDFVAIDFSSDNTPAQDRSDAARTLAGFGDGTFDYLDPGTKKIELVHSYGWYLRKMVVDVIDRGGNPLLCAGPEHPEKPGFGEWARYIATEQRIPLVLVADNGSGLVASLRSLPADPLAPFLLPSGPAAGAR